MNITAVVPARENNFGKLINKDVLPYGSTNLFTHKILQLKELRNVEIVVSTDSELISNCASQLGVKVLDRPSELSREETEFGKLVEYVCNQIDSEHILWTCVTSPLISADLYRKAIDKYNRVIEDGFDCLVSVQKLQRYLMDANGALNFRPGIGLKKKEELPDIYIATNGIAVARRTDMIKWKFTCGKMPFLFELEKRESIDICDEYDYKCAMFFGGGNIR